MPRYNLAVLSLSLILAVPATVRSFTRSALPLRHHPAAVSCRRCRKISIHATSITASSWKSCAQPRFDEFASWTIGPWAQQPSPSAAGENAPIQEVEEVMRSCGGAVQGIRELPLSMIFSTEEDGISEERTYHNRADGGFVYADDGSYSSGPEKWDWSTSEESEKLMMASLAFPDKRRMWLTVKLSEASSIVGDGMQQNNMLDTKILELSRPVPTEENGVDGDDISISKADLPNLDWEVIQRVRMPNSNQPWSLARAKWEKQETKADEASDEDYDATKIKKGVLVGWSYIESSSPDNANTLFGDVAVETINMHMLAVCPASGVARSVVRCYGTDGLLKSVAFLNGSLATTAKAE